MTLVCIVWRPWWQHIAISHGKRVKGVGHSQLVHGDAARRQCRGTARAARDHPRAAAARVHAQLSAVTSCRQTRCAPCKSKQGATDFAILAACRSGSASGSDCQEPAELADIGGRKRDSRSTTTRTELHVVPGILVAQFKICTRNTGDQEFACNFFVFNMKRACALAPPAAAHAISSVCQKEAAVEFFPCIDITS